MITACKDVYWRERKIGYINGQIKELQKIDPGYKKREVRESHCDVLVATFNTFTSR